MPSGCYAKHCRGYRGIESSETALSCEGLLKLSLPDARKGTDDIEDLLPFRRGDPAARTKLLDELSAASTESRLRGNVSRLDCLDEIGPQLVDRLLYVRTGRRLAVNRSEAMSYRGDRSFGGGLQLRDLLEPFGGIRVNRFDRWLFGLLLESVQFCQIRFRDLRS